MPIRSNFVCNDDAYENLIIFIDDMLPLSKFTTNELPFKLWEEYKFGDSRETT